VLIAMTVMAIGAAAVMTMQKASIQGNLDARRLDVANGIARMWEERLQADAMAWTSPNAYSSASNAGANNNAKLIRHGIDSAGQWFFPSDYVTPPTGGTPESYMLDILGRDLPTATNAVYCVAVRLSTLVPGSIDPTLLRADVRVLWLRGLGVTPASSAFCTSGTDATALNPDPNVYHQLYVTTALKENPAP
jgi:hypothetical protein